MANRNDDIVKRLRDHCYECQDEAADEIERLRKERDEARALAKAIAHDVSVLSTRPANIIKFGDLVDLINEWGDDARKILDKKENIND